MNTDKPSYYAIIPSNVRYDKELTPNAKLLYGEITALCNKKGYCWSTNSYFAEVYQVSTVTISKWVNQLAKKGYITTEMIYKEGTKEIIKRYIRIVNDPIKENVNTPIKEKFKDNSTSINNTYNNTCIVKAEAYEESSQVAYEESSYTKETKQNKELLFDEFWDLYDNKKGRAKSEIRFGKLSMKDKMLILENVPVFKTHYDEGFLPHPQTYLNNKYWLDEAFQVPKTQNKQKHKQEPTRANAGAYRNYV